MTVSVTVARRSPWGAKLFGSQLGLVPVFFFILVAVSLVANVRNIKFIKNNQGAFHVLSATESIEMTIPTTGLCPHVNSLYGGNQSLLQYLENSVQESIRFHQFGGSLKSVQRYLDSQVPDTIRRLGLGYEQMDPSKQKEIMKGVSPETTPAVEYIREYYRRNNVPRGGYGQPLPIRFTDHTNVGRHDASTPTPKDHHSLVKHVLYGERWMDVLETWSSSRYDAAVGPTLNPMCPQILRFAQGSYEEKMFCVDQNTKDETLTAHASNTAVTSSETVESACHIFSIGSNDQWGFEEDVMAKLAHCHTHTFDCTLPGPPRHKPGVDRVHFYPFCMGTGAEKDRLTKKKSAKYLSYAQLWNATGASSPPKLLKMDIEGFEFDTLISLLADSPSNTWPEQIMMEVHYGTRMVEVEWMLRTRQAAEMALFFDTLFNTGGYMPVIRKYFRGCPTCMEILLLRVHCNTLNLAV